MLQNIFNYFMKLFFFIFFCDTKLETIGTYYFKM